MGYRYGLNLAGGAQASSAQINDMVRAAVAACERFYPAFQLVAWGGETPGEGAWHRHGRGLRSRLMHGAPSGRAPGGGAWSCRRFPRRGLVLLGCGKMGSALLEGWLAGGPGPRRVTVLEPEPRRPRCTRSPREGLRLNAALPRRPRRRRPRGQAAVDGRGAAARSRRSATARRSSSRSPPARRSRAFEAALGDAHPDRAGDAEHPRRDRPRHHRAGRQRPRRRRGRWRSPRR